MKNDKASFTTDAYAGALAKNDEMNKNGKVAKEKIAGTEPEKKGTFTTDAFEAALKLNEDRNKKDMPPNAALCHPAATQNS